MKKKFKWVVIIASIIMLIALVLSFPFVGEKVGAVLGIAGDKVVSTARLVLGTVVGLFLVYVGVLALGSGVGAVVGIALIAVGLAITAFSLWPLFKKEPELVKEED